MSEPSPARESLRRALGPSAAARLDAWQLPAPSEALVARARARATALLREETRASAARTRPMPAPRGLAAPRWPVGFRRELGRLLAAALPPAAGVLALAALVVWRVPAVLEAWLPQPLATLLPVAYALASVGWLSLVVGSLPFLAHRRATARPREIAA